MDKKNVDVNEDIVILRTEDKPKARTVGAGRKPRPTAYDRDMHLLICDTLGVGERPEDPGDTAFEAVCFLLSKIQDAVNSSSLDEAVAALTRKQPEFGVLCVTPSKHMGGIQSDCGDDQDSLSFSEERRQCPCLDMALRSGKSLPEIVCALAQRVREVEKCLFEYACRYGVCSVSADQTKDSVQ